MPPPVPIVGHYRPRPEDEHRARVARLADELVASDGRLRIAERWRPLMIDRADDAPALHLDDLSAIPLMDRDYDVQFMQVRARLRAGDGDLVASTYVPDPAFEPYCREVLGLGAPQWLLPRPSAASNRVALACWSDREVRRTLVRTLRARRWLHVHPNMGIRDAWELAALLRASSRRPVKVVAPPPGLMAFVNDKLAFADLVRRLLGPDFVPRTERAANLALLSKRVHELAGAFRFVCVKVPDSAGGGGVLVIHGARFRGSSLVDTRHVLEGMLGDLRWDGSSPLLVGAWEEHVLCSPSLQLWIPPLAAGEPIIEGIFEQMLRHGDEFMGSRPTTLPPFLVETLAAQGWLLGRLFQLLGYVGRCSFDTLMLGPALDDARLKFVECNGRWGGTSTPMMLMNRLFGDWRMRPYATQIHVVPGLERCCFADLLAFFGAEMYDVRTGAGRLVFYNAGRMRAHEGIDVLGLGEDPAAAEHLVRDVVPRGLCAMVKSARS